MNAPVILLKVSCSAISFFMDSSTSYMRPPA